MILDLGRDELEVAARLVRRVVAPTPQYAWPLLCARAGCEVWVKHENHTATGAFKIRGGLVMIERLKRARPDFPGVASATRGNHGQSLAYAGRRLGVRTVIVVPHGNSRDKNVAMRAYFSDTHNVVEPAGAAPLAALLKDPARRGRRFAVIASGGNVDREVYAAALAG
ncbi:MAG: pyridoxal-phosphate dependent enzyme [Burkholderiales bacterium]|nr:pyridoxal-phosphate dependent enzyme [Burkholderiales bacterium]